MAAGKVYLIGAGPGRKDLITVRGRDILSLAEVVIYDYLVDKEILSYCLPAAELICTRTLGKDCGHTDTDKAQELINETMLERAAAGKKVVRLKNGDPGIFGRLTAELEALTAAGVDFEIVPGVTAAAAAAAYTGISLTDRACASSVVLVTGHEAKGKTTSGINWPVIAQQPSIVFYMAVCVIENIVARLSANGREVQEPVLVIANAGSAWQKTVSGTLYTIADLMKKRGITAPAVVIIGEVCRQEKKYNWLKSNKRILFTGLSAERPFLDGTYFHLPLIRIVPPADYRELDRAVSASASFDWLVFSSRYGVKYFMERLLTTGHDLRGLAGVKIVAIGQSTKAALRSWGLLADLVPKEESSQGLIELFSTVALGGSRMLLPRSDLADKGLTKALQQQGAEVTAVMAYRNIMADNLPDLDLSFFNEIMFTSPSTVRSFKKRYGNVPAGITITCIGKVTEKAVVGAGLRPPCARPEQ